MKLLAKTWTPTSHPSDPSSVTRQPDGSAIEPIWRDGSSCGIHWMFIKCSRSMFIQWSDSLVSILSFLLHVARNNVQFADATFKRWQLKRGFSLHYSHIHCGSTLLFVTSDYGLTLYNSLGAANSLCEKTDSALKIDFSQKKIFKLLWRIYCQN